MQTEIILIAIGAAIAILLMFLNRLIQRTSDHTFDVIKKCQKESEVLKT